MKYILIILMIVGFSSTAQAHDSYTEDTWRCLAEETAAYSYHMTVLHKENRFFYTCLLYTSPSPRDRQKSRMPSSA